MCFKIFINLYLSFSLLEIMQKTYFGLSVAVEKMPREWRTNLVLFPRAGEG